MKWINAVLNSKCWWCYFLIMAAAEELFFRLIIEPYLGIALTALLFAVAHLPKDLKTMLILISISVVCSYLAMHSIWLAIVAHFLYNCGVFKLKQPLNL